jgi:hypothetical protein
MADPPDTSRIEQLAETVGIEIAPAHREGVALNFARIATMAALVMDYKLPEDTETGLIFVP